MDKWTTQAHFSAPFAVEMISKIKWTKADSNTLSLSLSAVELKDKAAASNIL